MMVIIVNILFRFYKKQVLVILIHLSIYATLMNAKSLKMARSLMLIPCIFQNLEENFWPGKDKINYARCFCQDPISLPTHRHPRRNP